MFSVEFDKVCHLHVKVSDVSFSSISDFLSASMKNSYLNQANEVAICAFSSDPRVQVVDLGLTHPL